MSQARTVILALAAVFLAAVHSDCAEPAAEKKHWAYVAPRAAVPPDVKDAATVDQLISTVDVLQSTQFFDGIGRPDQTVIRQVSPLGKDMVTPQVYDPFGRESLQYLPYVSSSTDGNYKDNAIRELATFNNTQFPGEQFYYSQTVFEESPFNRPQYTYPAGMSWLGNNRGIFNEYLFNNAGDSVRIWNIDTVMGSKPVNSGMYAAGQLYKNAATDEAMHLVIEYKDKEGHVILKKTKLWNTPAAGHSGWLNTYYIYDDLDNLRFVIQPKAVEWLMSNSWDFASPGGWQIADELCFRYEYDTRNRTIIKKAPGAGEVRIVYDALDRVAMTQDSSMRKNHQWLVMRYDGLDRQDSTLLITDPTYWNDLTYHRNQAAGSLFYPNLASYANELLTVAYYDDYAWTTGANPVPFLSSASAAELITTYGISPDYAMAPIPYMITRGMMTGTSSKVLGTTSQYLTALHYYDDHGRVIQTQTKNSTGGVDTLTTQYSFSGKPLRTLLNHQKAGNITQHHDILTKMSYDVGLRLKMVYKNIDGAPDYLIDSMQYNELGQLKGRYIGAGIDNLSYDYNVRGWVTGINKSYVGGGTGNYFGMELAYDNPASVVPGSIYASAQFNGNISGVTWKTKGDSTKRKYDFTYDNVNRLQGANFLQNTGAGGWSNSLVNYTVDNLTYDANGNILSMNQRGFKWNGSALVDQLTYEYQNNSNSNKLKKVGDAANDSLSQLGDFHFKGTKLASDSDYRYDGNGNLVWDNNKAVDNIEYNYLNLPQKIHVKGEGNILYTYDARGNKLSKVVTDSLSRHSTTTLYMVGFVYQHTDTITAPAAGIDTLLFFAHEEGRARWGLHYYQNGTSKYAWENDFFEKDHLGNTRVVLTTQKDTSQYVATMEGPSRAKENALFYNIPQTAYSRLLSGSPPDGINPDDSVSMVNGMAGKIQGPAIILKVMAGDSVSLGVKAYYTSQSGTSTTSSITDALSSLASGVIGLTGGGKGTLGQLNTTTSPLYGALNSFITNKEGSVAGKPRAYLNWMLLDDQYQYDAVKSGAIAVGNYPTGVLNTLAPSSFVAAKSGFLYVWVSNETQGWPVFFDNLSIQTFSGPLLEETHYYPFGLTMAGISDKALKAKYAVNKYLYNGKELQRQEFSDGTGLEVYDYGARHYDPQIGRWSVPDPMAYASKRWSPYNYVYDNPLRMTDPDGMDPEPVGADDLTGKEWIKASRPGTDESIAKQYKKTNREKSQQGNNETNDGNDAGNANNNNNTANQSNWKPLNKSDLAAYFAQIHGRQGSDNDLGSAFEDLFSSYVANDPELNFRYEVKANNEKSFGPDRNTVPDFKGNAFVRVLDYKGKTTVIKIEGGAWFELKASGGGIYLSSNADQVKGHIDNMSKDYAFLSKRYVAQHFRPTFYLITTADVKFSEGISTYATNKNVQYIHVYAEYQKANGNWQFRFYSVAGSNHEF